VPGLGYLRRKNLPLNQALEGPLGPLKRTVVTVAADGAGRGRAVPEHPSEHGASTDANRSRPFPSKTSTGSHRSRLKVGGLTQANSGQVACRARREWVRVNIVVTGR
jgi:hypothetical protein